MKKTILLLIASLVFITCSLRYKEKPNADKFIGTWIGESGVYYSFAPDHTGMIGDRIEGERILWWDTVDDSLFLLVDLQPDTIRYKAKFQTERTLVINNTFKFRKR